MMKKMLEKKFQMENRFGGACGWLWKREEKKRERQWNTKEATQKGFKLCVFSSSFAKAFFLTKIPLHCSSTIKYFSSFTRLCKWNFLFSYVKFEEEYEQKEEIKYFHHIFGNIIIIIIMLTVQRKKRHFEIMSYILI